jgi:hypothetical protein
MHVVAPAPSHETKNLLALLAEIKQAKPYSNRFHYFGSCFWQFKNIQIRAASDGTSNCATYFFTGACSLLS